MHFPRRRVFTVVGILAMSLLPAAPALATVVNVGGGTWNYGSSYSFPSTKNAWSHYVHPTKYHSATSICGSENHKVYNVAGSWANANSQCNVFQSDAAYWATY